MFIELDIFSGKPNPRWELDEIHSQNLLQFQNQLEVSKRTPVEPQGLGYRGFWYSDTKGRVHAYRGFVKTVDVVLADPSFSIELFLLDQLPMEFAIVCRRIESEIADWMEPGNAPDQR
jgi:hypothetical protein